MARYLGDFAKGGLINIAGGCCGNTPEHIAAIAKALDGQHPRERGHGADGLVRDAAQSVSVPDCRGRRSRSRCACPARSRSRSSPASTS